jgi:hypothetical protein
MDRRGEKQVTKSLWTRAGAWTFALAVLAAAGCGGGSSRGEAPVLPDVAIKESGCRTVSSRAPWGLASPRVWTPRQAVADDSTARGSAVGQPFEARLVIAFGMDVLETRRQAVFELADGCRRQYAVPSLVDADAAVIDAAIRAHPSPADPASHDVLFEDGRATRADVDNGRLLAHTTQHFAFWRGVDTRGASHQFVAARGGDWDGFLQTVGHFMEQHWLVNRDVMGAPMPYAAAAERKKINVYICGTGLPFVEGGDLSDCGASAADAMWVSAPAMTQGATMLHEFTHVLQFYSGGFRDKPEAGPIWETVAEWTANSLAPRADHLIGYTDNLENGPLFSHARYGAFPFIAFLFESDRTRALVWKAWLDNQRTAAGATTEDFVPAFVRLAQAQGIYPDGHRSFADDVGWFGARLAAMDFEGHPALRDVLRARDGTALSAKREVPLKTTSTGGVFASPAERPLRQYGTHLVPLTAGAPGKVTVQLTGETAAQQAAWRFTLVSVAADGSVRYAAMGATEGRGSAATAIEHRAGEALYLAVTATPLAYESLGWQAEGPTKGTPFPYRVQFGNATPWTGSVSACNPGAGSPAWDLNYNTNGHRADGDWCPAA